MTPHNEAKFGEIAKNVIMPGDPLRAKYIAENFLEDAKLVNQIRCNFAYTGTYKGKDVTVMASGMGIPSMGIYAHELFSNYDVDNIIRIGTSGGNSKEIGLLDIVLSEQTYCEGNFAYNLNHKECHLVESSECLNKVIKEQAKESNIKIFSGTTITTEVFSPYIVDHEKYVNRVPKDLNPLSTEMEAFPLFYLAKMLNKNATCIMTVVNTPFSKENVSTEKRQKGLNDMISLALDSIAKL